jgi:ABC-2 type transport system permease protein
MTRLFRGEIIKAATTRTAYAYMAVGVVLAIVNVVIVTQFSVLDKVADKREALAGLPILLLLFGLVGAAGEYRHRTAAAAALAARSRSRILIARAGSYAAAGTAIAAVMVALTLAVGLPLLGGEPGPDLGTEDVAAVAAGSLLAAALSAVIGVAVGSLIRNQVAGVVGALILAFLGMEMLAAVREDAVGFTPYGSAAILAGDPGGGTLSSGAAVVVLAGWTLPLLFAAVVAERRRDLA